MSDVLIIGSGPAGISAALYAVRGGLDVMVLSRGPGALEKAEKIQNYYGFSQPVTGVQLEADGIKGAKRLGVHFVKGEVVSLAMSEELTGFVVQTPEKQFEAETVILAAGSTRITPVLPGIKALEGKGVSYCAICDAFFYKGKHVGVLGEGEYALHEAEILLPHAAQVTMFTNGKQPTVPIPPEIKVNMEKLEAIETMEDPGGTKVRGIRLASGTLLPVEGIFVALGIAGSVDLARKIGAATEGGRVIVDKEMATNVPGLYAAGDCTGGLLQVVKAAYEGAEAGLAVLRYLRGKKGESVYRPA